MAPAGHVANDSIVSCPSQYSCLSDLFTIWTAAPPAFTCRHGFYLP